MCYEDFNRAENEFYLPSSLVILISPSPLLLREILTIYQFLRSLLIGIRTLKFPLKQKLSCAIKWGVL